MVAGSSSGCGSQNPMIIRLNNASKFTCGYDQTHALHQVLHLIKY